LNTNNLNPGGSIKASVEVKNTGAVKGKEVVQLYLQDPYASTTRPVKELKGFQMIELAPGESKLVSFTLSEADLKFFNANQKWIAEPGMFHVFIGSDSSIKEKRSFEFK